MKDNLHHESEREDPLDVFEKEMGQAEKAFGLLFLVCTVVVFALIVLFTAAALIDSAMVKP